MLWCNINIVSISTFSLFSLFSTHYHTLPYTKEKGNIDIEPFIKLYQMYVILYKSAYKLKLWTTLIWYFSKIKFFQYGIFTNCIERYSFGIENSSDLKLNSIWQMYIFSSLYIKTTHNWHFWLKPCINITKSFSL